jgi:hypothetical protein
MEDGSFITRHRWSALWNGVIIGMGISGFMSGLGLFAIIPFVMGIGLEVMQRKRLTREQ